MTTARTKYFHLDFAWTAEVQTQTERLVLVSLASQANDDGWCWPSRRTIAARCCCTVETVSRSVAALAEQGFIEVHKRYKDEAKKQRTSNLYRVTPVTSDHHPPDAGSPPPVISDHHPPDLRSPESSSLNPHSESVSPSERVVGSTEPTPAQRKRAVQREEVEWRVEEAWKIHLKARARFFEHRNGREPSNAPTLTAEIRRSIRDAIREHDAGRLGPGDRERWVRESPVRAAGIGLFMDPWHTAAPGSDNDLGEGGRYYLESWRPWKRQRGKPDPVPGFSERYFEQRDGR